MSETDNSGLWQFSVGLYEVPAVRESCLSLQEAADADVNMLLTLLFAASRGIELDSPRVSRLIDSTGAWRQRVVEPLRSARRASKDLEPGGADLYQALKNVELDAEKVSQRILEHELDALIATAERSDPMIAARINLAAYATRVPMPEKELTALLAAFAAVTGGG